MNNPLFALKNKQKMLFILLCIALIGAVFFVWEKEKGSLYQSVWKSSLGFSDDEMDHAVGHTVTIQDESGKTISMAARGVVVNDEIITAQGNHYKIVKVKGNEAQAKLLGVDKQFIAYHDYFKTAEIPASVLAQTPKQCIGIYHTHSDESYVPVSYTHLDVYKRQH